MNWYIAKIVFNIDINNGANQSQFDEQFRLIESANLEDALAKGRDLGKKEETVFLNNKGETVHWNFIDVADLQPLQNLSHGTEIYSSTYVDEESKDYINFIRQKALSIQRREMIEA